MISLGVDTPSRVAVYYVHISIFIYLYLYIYIYINIFYIHPYIHSYNIRDAAVCRADTARRYSKLQAMEATNFLQTTLNKSQKCIYFGVCHAALWGAYITTYGVTTTSSCLKLRYILKKRHINETTLCKRDCNF